METWRATGTSVCGSKHRRQGAPTQDAMAWRATPQGLALAVADGHGSAPSFRSHIGARLAVETATALLAEYGERNAEYGERHADAAALSPEDGAWLAAQLVGRWREQVLAHAAHEPFEPPVTDAAAQLLSYGTTVLAALATPRWLLYCQLGDGDILLVSDAGKVARPWPRDQRLLGVETTSLCMPEAWREVHVGLQAVTPQAPALVLLCTDGYANSFRKDRGFLRVGRDILELAQTHGMAQVERDMESWLNEASALGSGDDITVGLLYRPGLAGGAGQPRPRPSLAGKA